MAKEMEWDLFTDGKATTETTTDALATALIKCPTVGIDSRQMKSTTPSPIQRQGSTKEYFSGGGERDDGYFDAHPWFDSDNEEFRSVNGDFGSSRSFTPIMDRIDSEEADDPDTLSTPQVLNRSSTSSNTGYLNVRPSRSSSSAKKQLIEFFSDSFSRDLRTEMEEESISKQPSGGFQKYSGTSSSTSTDRSVSSPRESMSKPIYNDPRTTTRTTNKKSAVKTSCILLVRSLSCGGGGGNVAEGGKKKKMKKRSRRHDFKQ
ncbi:unnamed protein product [Linum trigynum]|uniref:Uncharacterized protein n=2 Tax=Linum trigynum TaxID=586398 RepID=A0AAV2CEG4_9ROSI